MWILVVVSLLTYGTPQGATHTQFLKLYSETACEKAATKLNGMTPIRAFCVYDDISSSVLKGLEGVEKGLDNSFGNTKNK